MAKFEDMLQQYKVYKNFLYKLSPKDWQEEQKKKQLSLKRIRDEALEGSRGRQKGNSSRRHLQATNWNPFHGPNQGPDLSLAH